MGVPPTINLEREIILVSSILPISSGFSIPLGLSLFLRAAYRLLLYSCSQNGRLGEFINYIGVIYVRRVRGIVLHLIPVFILFIRRRIFICWVL